MSNAHWTKATLGCVADYINGRAFAISERENSGIPIIRIQNLTSSSDVINRTNREFDEKYLVNDGDILMAWSGTIDVFVWNGGLAWLNQHIFNVKEYTEIIDRKFLYYSLKNAILDIQAKTRGSGIQHITKPTLESHEILLPPLNEQKRIAIILDELMAEVEHAKEHLRKVWEVIQLFRQGILTSAISGKLTVDWRRNNTCTRQLSEVLQDICGQRISLSKNSREKQRIKTIFCQKEKGMHFHIPDSWNFIALDKLCHSFDYGSSNKSQNTGSVPVLRMGNLQDGKINWEKLKYSSDEDEISKYQLKYNDVLFNRTNSPELVGKTSIYKGEKKAIFASYLIRINCTSVIDPDYLNYCLNSTYAKDFCQRVKRDGVSQSNINAKKLANFEIPFCSIEEQRAIVKQVEKLFALADKLECNYHDALAKVEQLPREILSKAFQGKLVPQDPRDEPVSISLEKLKQNKLNLCKHSKKRKLLSNKKYGARNMKKKSEKVSLIDILKINPLSPDDLYRKSNYSKTFDSDKIEEFYFDLQNAIDAGLIKLDNGLLEIVES